jgi:hypothetical protein
VPDFSGGCTLTGATPTPPLVIPGGREPDWGPADVPAARPAPGSTPAPPPAPASPASPASPAAPKLSVKLKRSGRGVTVRVTLPSKGRLSVTAKAKGKVVGKASRTVKKGAVALKLRLKGHPRNVTVTVAFTPASGAARTGSATIR